MAQISVIMPVYNAEKTLRRSVDSFLKQTFKDFELLLINDGSTDGTGAICDDYALTDSRIRAIHTPNRGVSQARERGIQEATGEYSIHADGDDWVEPTMLQEMYHEAVANVADMVIADYYLETDQMVRCVQKPESLTAKEIVCDILTGKVHGSTCNKLVRHKLYRDFDIHFPAHINYCEDALTVIALLQVIDKVVYLPQAYYHYIYNSTSVTRVASKKKFEERKLYVNCLRELLADARFEEAIQQTVLRIKIDAYYSGLFTGYELKSMFPAGRKYIMNSSYGRNLKILMLLVSYGMHSLALYLERKWLHVD